MGLLEFYGIRPLEGRLSMEVEEQDRPQKSIVKFPSGKFVPDKNKSVGCELLTTSTRSKGERGIKMTV